MIEQVILGPFPMPPTVNKAYADVPFFKKGRSRTVHNFADLQKNVGCQRIITDAGKRYKQDASAFFINSGMVTKTRDFIEKHVTVDVMLYLYKSNWYTLLGLPNRNAGDSDGRVKLLQDAIFETLGIDDCCAFFSGARKIPMARVAKHTDTEDVLEQEARVIVVIKPTPDIIDEF